VPGEPRIGRGDRPGGLNGPSQENDVRSPRPQPNDQASDAPAAPHPGGDCRCRCGSLVARIVEAGVEIKCRRCKRDLLVPWSAREGWVQPVERAPRAPERAARPIAIEGGRR
jgi:hypothetical protein